MSQNTEDVMIPSPALSLRTNSSCTHSPLQKDSPSKDMNEFIQILGDQKTNNKNQQVFQFLQNHPSVVKVLAVYQPQPETNLTSNSSSCDVLSIEGVSLTSTHQQQSSQKSANSIPHIRVPAATISPEKNVESKTTKNYETRGIYYLAYIASQLIRTF
jgi:hypothetical protein